MGPSPAGKIVLFLQGWTPGNATGVGEANIATAQNLTEQLLREQEAVGEPTIEHLRTLLRARGWSMHLKKRRGKPYVYATRKVGQHTQSRYLASLNNLAVCLAATSTLPNAKEGEQPGVAQPPRRPKVEDPIEVGRGNGNPLTGMIGGIFFGSSANRPLPIHWNKMLEEEISTSSVTRL